MIDWLLLVLAWGATLLGVDDRDPGCRVLGALDVVRSQALAAGDVDLLADVYADADLLAQDREVVQDYAARGLRVVGPGLQRASCRAVDRGDGRVQLQVVDRLATTWVVGADGRRALPTDGPTRRTVVLERDDDGRWRIASVR